MGTERNGRRAPPRIGRARRARDYERARLGEIPAEALSQADRWALIVELHRGGWSDREIAELTSLSEYSVDRIRRQLGLLPNPNREGK